MKQFMFPYGDDHFVIEIRHKGEIKCFNDINIIQNIQMIEK